LVNFLVRGLAVGRLVLLLALSSAFRTSLAVTPSTAPPVAPPEDLSVCNGVGDSSGNLFESAQGAWWNPRRDGTGWQLMRFADEENLSADQTLAVAWFTYDQMGRPTWLLSPPESVEVDGSWRADLIRYSWNYGSGGTAGASAGGVRVGSVAMRFDSNDSARAAIVWQWDEASANAQPAECIGNFSQVQNRGEPLSVNAAFTGAWWESALPGWGVTLNVVLNTANGDNRYAETTALTLFDDAGNPVWLLGEAPQLPHAPSMGPRAYPLSTYFAGQGYLNGVPTADCLAGQACFTLLESAADLRRSFQSTAIGDVAFEVNATASELQLAAGRPLGGMSLTKFDRPLATSGTQRDDDSDLDPPLPVNGEMGASVRIAKLSRANLVVVDRTLCAAPGSATTCLVEVNWSAHAVHSPGAALFQRNLSTGAVTLLQAGGQSGEHSVSLPINQTFRFEVRHTSEQFSPLLAISPTVTVTGNQPPTVSMTSPTAGVPHFAPASIALAADANDPDGSITKVEFVKDGQILATDYEAPFQHAWTNVAAGTYSVSARAYDNANPPAVRVTAPLTIIVSTPPAAVLPLPDVVSDRVGATLGESRVDEAGAATYTIPIYAAPGTAGVAPKLALSYSSQAPSGAMGRGWSISGISAITRCRATREAGDPEGVNAPAVNLSISDRFCLDGQRLLAAPNSPACAVFSQASVVQLRTETESYQRVCAYTLNANPAQGPRFFTVEGKDGSTQWFGDRKALSSLGSDAVPSGFLEATLTGQNNAIYQWALVRSQDSSGNYIDYTYLKNPGGTGQPGEQLLDRASYTGKLTLPGQTQASVAPYAYVSFQYEADARFASKGFFLGGERWRTRRLESVTSAADNIILRSYRLEYLEPPGGGTEPRLDSVTECRPDAQGLAEVCLAPTGFDWSSAAHGFSALHPMLSSSPGVVHTGSLEKFEGYKYGDIDGDGRPDMVWVKDRVRSDSSCQEVGNPGNRTEAIFISHSRSDAAGNLTFESSPSQFFCAPREFLRDDDSGTDSNWFLLDYDGDGRDDLFIRSASAWQGHKSVPDGNGGSRFDRTVDLLQGLTPSIPAGSHPDQQPQLTDLNGDGLTDLIYSTGAGVSARLMERTGTSFGWGAPWQVTVPNDGSMCPPDDRACSVEIGGMFRKRNYQQLNDFNGDARSDLMMHIRITTSCDDLPDPVPVDGPPVITSEEFLALSSGQPQPNGAANCVVPWVYAMTVKSFVEGGKGGQNRIIATEPYNNARWPNAYFQGVSFTDLNGDGLTDYFNHAEKDGSTTTAGKPVYAINNGLGFDNAVMLDNLPAAGLNQYHQRKFIQLLDVNGDGRSDIVMPNASGATFETRLAKVDGGFNAPTSLPGNTVVTECSGSSNVGDCLKKRSFQFGDYDADGALDYLMLIFNGENDLKYRAGMATQRHQPRHVITRITNGFGAETEFSYLPLSNRAVYRPDVGSRNALQFGRGSPVSDLRSPMYVVHRTSSSAPIKGAPFARSEVIYRYVGAKLQAGGRGFLGFREIHSIDPNHANANGQVYGHVVTVTQYRQDFPFNGMPKETAVDYVPGAFVNDPCAEVGVAPPASACYLPTGSVAGQPFAYANKRALSHAKSDWVTNLTTLAGSVPQQVYLQRSTETKFNLDTQSSAPAAPQVLSHLVTENDDVDGFGNVRITRACTYASAAGNPTCPAGAIGGAIAKTETISVYGDNAARWRLGRLTSTTLTFKRGGGVPDITRRTDYSYDMASSAMTGLLTAEKVQASSGDAQQALATYYVIDAFGNRTGKHVCNASMSEAACRSTAILFASNGNDMHVHRYERQQMDGRGRFVSSTHAPFSNGTPSGSVELQTSTVLGRGAFGDVTHARDLNGVDVHSVAGFLGRPYYTWTETVPGGAPGFAGHGIETRNSLRWCAASEAGGVACPQGAVYREESRASGKPTQWSFVDLLGRPLMSVSESFFVAGTGNGERYTASCRFHDAQGRVAHASEPFFLTSNESASSAPAPAYDACERHGGLYATTDFDALSRPTLSIAADDSAISYTYQGLTTTFHDALLKARTEVRNALGELANATDAEGLQTIYGYNAAGNLTSVTRDGNNGVVTSSMGYDTLGRKTSSHDPDAGSWTYRYNALGELVQQIPGSTTALRIEQRYDARGRVVLKRVYDGFGALETTHQYQYDTSLNGRGQLANESVSGTYRSWGGDAALANTFSRSLFYDSLGRPQGTSTFIDGSGYHTAVEYDALSRAWKSQDASGEWMKREYTAQGHVAAQCASFFGDVTQTCGEDANTYVRTLKVNARGNVTHERRGDRAELEVSRVFNALTGRLERICSGNQVNCSLQLATYQWDSHGNLDWRDIAGQYREEFDYDDNHRLTDGKYTRLLNGPALPDGQHVTSLHHRYDLLGNICQKLTGTQLVSFGYGQGSGCGSNGLPGLPASSSSKAHAADRVGGRVYYYDGQGNQNLSQGGGDLQRMIRYTGEHQAHEIELGVGSTSTTTRFWYGSDGARYKREDRVGGGVPTRTLYLGNVEIITGTGGAVTKRYLAGVAVQELRSSGITTRYLFHDHLGSVARVANANGGLEGGTDFGPFGERRGFADPRVTGIPLAATTRGFTGHEMVDGMDVVHMNGRIYDSKIARFLQADPIIQEPNNPQNFNRYSYTFNNPLNATDPSGYMSQAWRQAIGIIVVVVAVVTQQYWLGEAATWGQVATYYAAVGAVSGGISTGTTKGALWGALSGFATGAIGSLTKDALVRASLIGLSEGSIGVLQGGKFGHAFASSSLSSYFGGKIDAKHPMVGTIKAALLGGSISAATGGKFANGAATAAFSYAFGRMARRGHGELGYDARRTSAGGVPYRTDAPEEFAELLRKYPEIGEKMDATMAASDRWGPNKEQGFYGYTPDSGSGSATFVDMPQPIFRWDSLTFGHIPYMPPPAISGYSLDVVYHSHPFDVCFNRCMPGQAQMGPSQNDGLMTTIHPTAFHVIQQTGGHTFYYGPRALGRR
jgi:RHS repeat-associated protein